MAGVLVLAQANGVQDNLNLIMNSCFVRALCEESTKNGPGLSLRVSMGLNIVENSRDWAEWGVRTAHDIFVPIPN